MVKWRSDQSLPSLIATSQFIVKKERLMSDSNSIEVWKSIPGYGERYEISDHGRVRSSYREQEFDGRWGRLVMRFPAKSMTVSRTPTGYCYLCLSKDAKAVKHLLHRLVMLAFVGDSELQVNHIDGDKNNNLLSNLEYVTSQQNLRHCIDVLGKKRGEGAGGSKLKTDDIKKIREDDRFLRLIAQDYGVSLQAIHLVKSRRNWGHIL